MVKHLYKNTKRVLVSLRFSILFIFITLIVATTASIMLLRSWVTSAEIAYTSLEIMHYAAEVVNNQLTQGINPAALQGQFSAHLFEQGVLKDDPAQLVPYTYNLVKTMPLAQRAFWADEDGDYIYALKEPDGSITSDIYDRRAVTPSRTLIYRNPQGDIIKRVASSDMHYDHRKMSWYIKSKKDNHFRWTDIHSFYPDPHVGIAAVSPVVDAQKKFTGVFGININLNYLSSFISRLHVSKHGFAFIVSAKEALIAFPSNAFFKQVKPQPEQVLNVHTISLPLINKTLDLYNKTGQSAISTEFNGQTYLVIYEPVKDLAEYGWLIGVVTPRQDFTGVLDQMNLLTLCISLLILIVGILIVSNLVTRIVKPINILANETTKIKRFELDGDIRIQSRIKEVIHLRDAIRAMKFGLRSFQRYVPKILVKQLVDIGEDIRIGGVRRQLVVFFSDIQNFTTIAEKMDPNELMVQLCEYLEELTQIIISEKGTIDKYIGDAIMAFWGAPLPEAEPCEHAARAALRCEARLDKLNAKWKSQGKPRLNTRIGINIGEAIVGNLGSSERLNYTALGDTINMASRLESINKTYKTKIIVSETVYQTIKDKFVLRLIDCIAVKGRTATTCIYELLGEDASKLSFNVHAYTDTFNKAYAAYEQKDWINALAGFKECLAIYPADTIAPLFIERCKQRQK